METKRIADHGERRPADRASRRLLADGFMANVHPGAAISSLMAVEHHGLDMPWWTEIVTGIDPEYLADGYVTVPEARASAST